MANKKATPETLKKAHLKTCQRDIFGYCDGDNEGCKKDWKTCRDYVGANKAFSDMLGRDVAQDPSRRMRNPHPAPIGPGGVMSER